MTHFVDKAAQIVDIFLDTSVLLSACGSDKGASRFIIESANQYNWVRQVRTIAAKKPHETWTNSARTRGLLTKHLDQQIDWQLDALTSDDIILFDKAKDRPVLISALYRNQMPYSLWTEQTSTTTGAAVLRHCNSHSGEWLMEQRESGAL